MDGAEERIARVRRTERRLRRSLWLTGVLLAGMASLGCSGTMVVAGVYRGGGSDDVAGQALGRPGRVDQSEVERLVCSEEMGAAYRYLGAIGVQQYEADGRVARAQERCATVREETIR